MVWPFDCYNITNRREKKKNGRKVLFILVLWYRMIITFFFLWLGARPIDTNRYLIGLSLRVCVVVAPMFFALKERRRKIFSQT